MNLGFPCGSAGKEITCNVGDLCSIPGLGRFPGGRVMATHSSILAREFQGQRSLAGYRPWGHKELFTTKQLAQTLKGIRGFDIFE